MIDKRLLILGAGKAQENLIRASKELGYYTIVCDMRSGRPAEALADRYYKVDYMDKDVIYKIAVEECIDGVISNSEPAMLSVSYLVDKIGLPGNSIASIQRLLSKSSFRQLQKQTGVFAPASFEVSSFEEVVAQLHGLKYPIIIKPSESSGSRGTTKFDRFNEEEMREAFNECKAYSRNSNVTIEEFVPMSGLDVYNADVFLVDGTVLWDGWYGGRRSELLPMVPMAKVLPPIIADGKKKQIEDVVEKLLHASGVRLGEFNVESYITNDDEIFIIEINPRQAGDDIPRLIYEHSGINLTKLLVSLSVDDRRYYEEIKGVPRKNEYITLQVVFPHKAGTYRGLFIHENLRKYVVWMNEFIQEGSCIEVARNAADSVAYVDLRFDNREEQVAYTREIEKYIYPIID